MTATTILMTPTTALENGTLYTVYLKTDLAGLSWDNEGVSLQREYTWSFHTLGDGLRRIYLPVVARNN
jgi:hypothetical protein